MSCFWAYFLPGHLVITRFYDFFPDLVTFFELGPIEEYGNGYAAGVISFFAWFFALGMVMGIILWGIAVIEDIEEIKSKVKSIWARWKKQD